MKKAAFLLIFVLLFGLISCGGTDSESRVDVSSQEESIEPTSQTQEEPVDELTPVDGEYHIYSAEGLKNISNHLDADFVLAADIDLGGELLQPFGSEAQPFCGSFNGRFEGEQHVIKNFRIAADSDGNAGLFAVNAGSIINLAISDAGLEVTSSTARAGVIAGLNKGIIKRCNVGGDISADMAQSGAVIGGVIGENTLELSSTDSAVNIIAAAGEAGISFGLLTGSQKGGKLADNNCSGAIDIAAAEGNNIGLFCGAACDTSISNCIYFGEKNLASGKLMNKLCGNKEDTELTDCLWRDNSAEKLPDNILALRKRVEEGMRAMGSVKWAVSQNLGGDCYCTNLSGSCRNFYVPGQTYIGLPYQHKAGNLARFMYCLDENNVVKDWVYELNEADGFDTYMGNDCSSAVQHSWALVANSMDVGGTGFMLPDQGRGTLPVGDWNWKLPDGKISNYSEEYRNQNGEEVMYEAYAAARMGDCIVHYMKEGGHAILVAKDAVVMRDINGKINPNQSYLTTHEQGHSSSTDTWSSTWTLDRIFYFADIYEEAYMPVTIKELVTGETEEATADFEGGEDGWYGIISGKVTSNYFLSSVSILVTDAAGNEVVNHEMFTTAGKNSDYGTWQFNIRDLKKEFEMERFTPVIAGLHFDPDMNYHCTIVAHLGNEQDIQVKEFDF